MTIENAFAGFSDWVNEAATFDVALRDYIVNATNAVDELSKLQPAQIDRLSVRDYFDHAALARLLRRPVLRHILRKNPNEFLGKVNTALKMYGSMPTMTFGNLLAVLQ